MTTKQQKEVKRLTTDSFIELLENDAELAKAARTIATKYGEFEAFWLDKQAVAVDYN